LSRAIAHPGPSGPLLYTLAHGVRFAWFYTQSRLAGRRMSAVPKKADLPRTGATMPERDEVFARLGQLLRRDFDNINAGLYRMPHDLLPRPLVALRLSRKFFADLEAVDRRRRSGASLDVLASAERAGGRRFPRYYLQNFHFQTDGYLSEASAELYDYQVEVMFYGAADAMRRQALVALGEVLHGRRLMDVRLLDIGAGTGRFLTFVKDNYPRLLTVALDLSPHYLRRAKATLARETRCAFINAAAEAMPLKSASIDIITCVYLLHELPRKVRHIVAREAARVLKPGGRFILVDSLQRGDDPPLDPLLELFPRLYHEPYYDGYVRTDLERLFATAGLVRVSSELAYFSKIMVFDKPRRNESDRGGKS
jgi:ubiquinone/menaquinone biosynthesis C-methylase UbiE